MDAAPSAVAHAARVAAAFETPSRRDGDFRFFLRAVRANQNYEDVDRNADRLVADLRAIMDSTTGQRVLRRSIDANNQSQ